MFLMYVTRIFILIFLFVSVYLYAGKSGYGAENNRKNKIQEIKFVKSDVKISTPPILKNIKTKIKDPMGMRDPFKKPKLRGDNDDDFRSSKPYWEQNGIQTNFGIVDLAAIDFNKVKVTGILLGPKRRVMAEIGDEKVILKEGMKFGKNKELELKAILPGGIVLIEKIKNVYNQDEYIEIVVPVFSGSRKSTDSAGE